MPPEMSQNLLKNAQSFSSTDSLFFVRSPLGVNLETGGITLLSAVPVAWTI